MTIQNDNNPSKLLGEKPIMPLLFEYALPSIMAMVATSLYNLVDSIFIGRGVGALAISGLALVFPLMNLATAFGSLVGMGGAMLTSLRLGQKDYMAAKRILGCVVALNLIIGIGFTLAVLPNLDWVLGLFGASEQTLPYARDYMSILLYGNVITHLYFGLNAILRSAGYPVKSMTATLGAVLINIILDPLFIYVLDWGIKGAAIATVAAQATMLLWQVRLLSDKTRTLHFDRSCIRVHIPVARRIFAIGVSPFAMHAASSCLSAFINRGLMQYGSDLSVGAYGIVYRFAYIFLMIVMGLNQGMQPIAGYNFGAGAYDRVKRVYIYTLMSAVVITSMGFIVAMFFPHIAVKPFTSDAELTRLTIDGMHIVFVMFPLVSMQMVTSNLFQSIGKPRTAIIMSLSRQVILLLPMLVFLPKIFERYTNIQPLWGIWYSMPLADLGAFVLGVILIAKLMRDMKKGKIDSVVSKPQEVDA